MIKELINNLAYDKITLTQGLTVAKIIAAKIENSTFQKWIKNELNGYDSDESIPSYRSMFCVVKGTIVDFFGRNEETIPISFENWGKEIQKHLNYQYFTQSISALEENYKTLDSETGFIEFLPEQVLMLENMMKLQAQYQRKLLKAGRVVPRLQIKNIIELTKQKLLDTLLELDKEFPNLENSFTMNKDNNEKVQNIITNNIYGSNNPVNVAAGNKVEQKDIHNTISVIDYSQLEKLGVEAKDIEELKLIVETNGADKPTLKGHAMKWLGRVSASVAGRGLYDNIPAITDFIQGLI